ncbi:hypothetical protein P8452_58573 [Trifolium repens]|nr:hypothetical protein P8452_58573 [Trifolium repens]
MKQLEVGRLRTSLEQINEHLKYPLGDELSLVFMQGISIWTILPQTTNKLLSLNHMNRTRTRTRSPIEDIKWDTIYCETKHTVGLFY